MLAGEYQESAVHDTENRPMGHGRQGGTMCMRIERLNVVVNTGSILLQRSTSQYQHWAYQHWDVPLGIAHGLID